MDTFTGNKVDLSWVTFAEENPTEPCDFYNCTQNADYLVTALPCRHEYKFCSIHTEYTKMVLDSYDYLSCAHCPELVTDCKYDPIKRG